MSAYNLRRGITAVEVIVVVVVILLLVILLLPAIQAPRVGHGFHGSCRNNMKQIGLALQNHMDAYKTLPPLYFNVAQNRDGMSDPALTAPAYSWNVRMLPFMEEEPFYKAISQSSNRFTLSPEQVLIANPDGGKAISPGMVEINTFRCPAYSGETETSTGAAVSNYIAISATRQQLLNVGPTAPTQADGVLIPNAESRGLSLAAIKDGTAKTIVFAESTEQEQASWYHWQQTFACGFPPAHTSATNPQIVDGKWSASGLPAKRTALNYGPKLKDPPYQPNASDPLRRTYGPSSDHNGGIVIHGMADGSVQEFTTDIDPEVYYRLITRAGNDGPDKLP
jgi:hypothetical protein